MPDIGAITRAINDDLPAMARSVIRSHLDLHDPKNQAFLRDPDGRGQHQVQWHQWGIITHTRVFLGQFDRDVICYLRSWSMLERVNQVLKEEVDGVSKWDLLRIAILLHDIGKFAVRFSGKRGFHFTHHEELSGMIIRSELDLAGYGLTHEQIEYIARAAEDHFVLGLVRKRAREEHGYGSEFMESERFRQLALRIKAEHPEDYVEVGILFLGDSLAKTHPVEGPEMAVSQYDINIALAHRYLAIVFGAEG